MREHRRNWAGNVEFNAERWHEPADLAQLQTVVSGAARLRAVGTGHSFNRIADCSADMVSLSEMPTIRRLDEEAGTVTVDARTRYGELAGWLHERGQALHNLGSLPHISVGGACATGTHGSGDHNRNLSSAVSALEMVTADGELVALGRRANPEIFDGVVLGLGALGVVTSLTLDIEPTYDVAQVVMDGLGFDQLLHNVDEIFASGYSVSVFTGWGESGGSQIWCKIRAGGPEPEPGWLGTRPAEVAHHPIPGISAVNCTEQFGVPGAWHERLPHFKLAFTPSSGDELQTEYLLPREHAAQALAALDGIRGRIAPVLLISELRTVAADSMWLSPSYGSDTLAIHFTWVQDHAAVAPVVSAIEERLAPFAPRPHWGKVFGTPAGRAVYPRWEDFRALMGTFDPAGKFRNEWIDHVFA